MPLPGDQHRDNAATTNPFEPVVPRVAQWAAQEIATLQSRLDKQLGPEYISTRPGAGGGRVHYLAAEKVINLANEVFGFNGWSSAIQNVTVDFVDENTTSGKVNLGLSTIVRVTLRDGTYHEDIGYGHIENCKGKAAAFEKAKKEAATDALKRALRNFGNVLGNCLYDKDYLGKVTKLKVAPSRWDSENLHRHPDFAPIKREVPVAQGNKDPQQGSSGGGGAGVDGNGVVNGNGHGNGNGNQTIRVSSIQSAASTGSGEFEDDFGVNVFDDTDFGHPDEVRLDDSRSTIESPAQRQMNQQRDGVQRMHSMPHLRPPNVQQVQPPAGPQAPQRPPAVQRPPNNVNQVGRMGPPQTPGQQQRNGMGHQVPDNLDGAANRSNISSAEEAQQHANGRPQGELNGERSDHLHLPVPKEPPPGAAAGFMNGRGAAAIQSTDAIAPNASIAFNPHAESPSIRRTHGINPGKSAPVMRQSLSGALASAAGQSAPGQPTNQQQANGAGGGAAPNRANFVNPSADPNRRVGMPGGGGPQNRGAYKPPTNLKRPALSDVSNLPQMDGAADVKKQKVDSPAPAQQGGAQNGAETS